MDHWCTEMDDPACTLLADRDPTWGESRFSSRVHKVFSPKLPTPLLCNNERGPPSVIVNLYCTMRELKPRSHTVDPNHRISYI